MKSNFKKLALFILYMLWLSICAYAQPTDSISFETVESFTYFKGDRSIGYLPGMIVEFQGNKIISTAKDQTKNIYITEWTEGTANMDGEILPTKEAWATDNGGFRMHVTYLYDPVVELYAMSFVYRNINHIHYMKPTDKVARPPIYELPNGNPVDVQYTDEEVIEFLKIFKWIAPDFYSLNWL